MHQYARDAGCVQVVTRTLISEDIVLELTWTSGLLWASATMIMASEEFSHIW